jgi:hypothetical protein
MATDEKILGFQLFFGHNFCKEKGKKGQLFGGGSGGNFNLVLCFLGGKRREIKHSNWVPIKSYPTDCKSANPLNFGSLHSRKRRSLEPHCIWQWVQVRPHYLFYLNGVQILRIC